MVIDMSRFFLLVITLIMILLMQACENHSFYEGSLPNSQPKSESDFYLEYDSLPSVNQNIDEDEALDESPKGWKRISLDIQSNEYGKPVRVRLSTIIKEGWFVDDEQYAHYIRRENQDFVFSYDFIIEENVQYYAPADDMEIIEIGNWKVWRDFRIAPPKGEKDFLLYNYGLILENHSLVVFTFTGYDGEIQEEIPDQEFIIENTKIEIIGK